MKTKLLAVLLALFASTLSAQVAFSDALNLSSTGWTATPSAQGNGTLSFTAGGLVFQVPSSTGNDTAYCTLNSYAASAASNWSAQVDVHLAAFASLGAGQHINMNLILYKVGDVPNSNATLSLDRYNSGSGVVADIDTYLTVGGMESHFPETLSGTTDATLRYSYDATTKQLTYAYDADGALNGASFLTISSRDLSGWNLTNGDMFGFVLVGASGGPTVSVTDAVFQNFSVSAATIPEPTTSSLLSGGLLLALAFMISRRTLIVR